MPKFATTSLKFIEPSQSQVHNKAADLTQSNNKELYFTLTSTLQNSLDLKETLKLFYNMVQKAVSCSGMNYQHKDKKLRSMLDNKRAHKANYTLKTADNVLGEITFYRRERFSEEELTTMESLLGILMPPLRNALLYLAATEKSLLDPLTRVGNRAAMESQLKREFSLAKRNSTPLSLLMTDIDYFKKVNDKEGHPAGDRLLIKITEALKNVLRETDQVFRFGGEEFMVLLSDTGHDDAMIIAERIRLSVEKTSVKGSSSLFSATVSIGVSTCLESDTKEQLLERADKALYRAKRNGRNRVESEAEQEATKKPVCSKRLRAYLL